MNKTKKNEQTKGSCIDVDRFHNDPISIHENEMVHKTEPSLDSRNFRIKVYHPKMMMAYSLQKIIQR